jgi:putative lipoprotein
MAMTDRGWCRRLGAAALVIAAAVGCAGGGGSDQQRPAPSALLGSEWLAEDIRGGGVLDRIQSTVMFGDDQAAYGSGGCNRFRGSATVSGQDLRFGPLASTMMACPPAVMDQERKFLDALEATRSYRFEGPFLYFLDAGGARLIKFTKLTAKAPPQ